VEKTKDPTDGASPTQGRSLPSLPSRLVAVFFSPGKLMEQLAAEPRWVGALLVGAVIVGLSMVAIPLDLFLEMNREQALSRGVDFPELGENALRAMRVVIPLGSVLSTVVFSFVFAGLYTVIFAFILGDEGRFGQYLAVVSHAWFIAVLFGLLVTPLRIATGNPQYTLNLGSFMLFLPDGYLLNVFRAMDLTQIWSMLVIAQGAHAIDTRRSFTSAATILMGILLAMALVLARFL